MNKKNILKYKIFQAINEFNAITSYENVSGTLNTIKFVRITDEFIRVKEYYNNSYLEYDYWETRPKEYNIYTLLSKYVEKYSSDNIINL